MVSHFILLLLFIVLQFRVNSVATHLLLITRYLVSFFELEIVAWILCNLSCPFLILCCKKCVSMPTWHIINIPWNVGPLSILHIPMQDFISYQQKSTIIMVTKMYLVWFLSSYINNNSFMHFHIKILNLWYVICTNKHISILHRRK